MANRDDEYASRSLANHELRSGNDIRYTKGLRRA